MKESKYEKIVKILGVEVVKEIEAQSVEQLKQTVVTAEQAMDKVQQELEENPEYEALKEKLADVTAAKKEVNKYQKAKIALALDHLKGHNE